MPERFAIYYAPADGSVLAGLSTNWLARPELTHFTVSVRRYQFHATLKAPMPLKAGIKRDALSAALAAYGREHAPVSIGRIEVRAIDGFLALVPVVQSRELTDFAGRVVESFDRFRAPLDEKERQRRLSAPLTDRQIRLLDKYGYPYVLEQFQFHMTLTDRLPTEKMTALLADARAWFAPVLGAPLVLDRLVLFSEAEARTGFIRGDDYPLVGTA